MSEPVHSFSEIPKQISIAEVVSSRYEPTHVRPRDWDERVIGEDLVKTSEGELVKLQSDGQQSPPQPGWVILLTGGDSSSGYTWTLYGMPKGATFSERIS